MSRRHPMEHHPHYRPPEPPRDWHEQDWWLILDALEEYLWNQPITDGQELRLCQLIESIAKMHGTVSLGAIQRLDAAHFDQYDHQE